MKRRTIPMSEIEIRKTLSKIKIITKRILAIIFSTNLGADNDGISLDSALSAYTENIKGLIGSINEVKSERILKALGFEKSKDNPNKFLIPANALYLIKPGTEVTSITGKKCIIDEIDLDTRSGMLGYYITIEGIKK